MNDDYITAINAFAARLHDEVDADGNSLLSPYSIAQALLLVAVGARGQTVAEMHSALCLPDGWLSGRGEHVALDTETALQQIQDSNHALRPPGGERERAIRAQIQMLRGKLQEAERQYYDAGEPLFSALEQQVFVTARKINELLPQVDQYQLHVANSLWCQAGFPFQTAYLDAVQRYCGPCAYAADFVNNREGERGRINDWVAEHTAQKINESIPPGMLDALTRMVLVNAIYFKGEWQEPFDEAQTEPGPFTRADGQTLTVPFMNTFVYSRYAAFNSDGSWFATPVTIDSDNPPRCYPDDGGFAILDLPYKGEAVSMLIVVPRDAANLPAVERTLRTRPLADWASHLQQKLVRVELPKFRLETTTLLSDVLRRMGMSRVWVPTTSADAANLSGISSGTSPEERLYLSEAIHKTFLEVNEKGTEAAGDTALVDLVGAEEEPFTPEFKADRPFLVCIRHRPTGLVLFLGRVNDPTV